MVLTSHVLGGGGGVVDSFVHIYMILFILDKHLLNASHAILSFTWVPINFNLNLTIRFQ